MVFLSLLLLPLVAASSEWKPTCGATQRQAILDLISTDLFVRHFNSDAINSTLTECSNFHRHLCPKEGMSNSASFQSLFDQVVAIERKCTKYDVFTKIEKHFNFADSHDYFDYTNDAVLSILLFLMPESTLVTIYEYTTLQIQAPGNYFSNVWDLRHWTPSIDQAKFPAKYDPTTFTNLVKKKAFTDSLAAQIKNITQAAGGMKNMSKAYLPFLKDVTDYNHIANVMYREGYEWGITRDRHHDAITKVAEEYDRALQAAAWSTLDNGNGKTRYDRFYDLLMDIYHNTLHSDLNNIGVQNASITFARDFHNFYVAERSKLSSLFILPHLRNFIAVNRAHARTIATIDLDMPNRWKITKGSIPDVLSGFFVWICVRNMAIFDLVGHNSPDGAVFGVMAYLYGHEMYHGVERETYPVIMPNSPVTEDSKSCVKSFFAEVGTRFPGDYRITFWPMEEEADLYGTQIAYGAFKTAIGSRIDDLAYPSLGITQRKLFFYANSIFGCNVHGEMKINGGNVLYDANYEVNGRLAQIPEFQSTFQCSATDNMVFPASTHCNVFFPTYPA